MKFLIRNILNHPVYRKLTGIYFAFLIVNFSANFIGLTETFFDTFIVDVQAMEENTQNLTLQISGMSAEENQEEESGHSHDNKHEENEAEYLLNEMKHQFLQFSKISFAYSDTHFYHNFIDTPYLPPWA
jgi:hypothetical protein